ncbi:LLM class flavin-dependent oxidoreductase [Symbioplanes lichenis]|uniref:LLM class flavin-dependent oxidoreductase n=1 Tax=Symbioplanes lichenis TaxID=1629072 RepID=UPI002739A9A3|nr:LLM class flavin-dependent oxidoreductase [Actinoplanes lichenis]
MLHRLEFGALVTGAGAAVEAERRGLDLVAVQGDGAWTRLSWIAGVTERIGLVAQIDLAEHAPAVLARSAASLDLLTGGRVTLALADEPGTAEAVEIVRNVLDAGEPRPYRHLGEHYRVPQAQRGPLPAHRIAIWLTGADARSVRLAGRTAEGWIGTPDELAATGKLLDEAAAEVGREAAEIRRVVILDPRAASASEPGAADLFELSVAALLPLVVEHGAGTFLLRTDDPDELRRFAELREVVLRELPEPPPAPIKPAAVRAKRRPGIDYDNVPASLAATAVEPGDLDYARVRSTYMRGGAPGLVLRPRSTGEVADALAFVRAHPGVPFGLRSGGHGMSGRSTNDGGIVLSVQALDTMEVLDAAERLVRIGPGARWADVARFLMPYGWALSSGDYGGVGVSGLATAGGVGWLAREHGLTIDHLRAVKMVLADGSVVRASDDENPDLFWAVRGAGANFGVVTSFDFQVDEVGDVGFAQLVVAADDPADLLVRWGRAIEAAPRTLSGQLIMGPPRPGQPAFAQLMAVVDAADPSVIVDTLQPLAQLAPLYNQNVVLTPYAGIVNNAAEGYHSGQGDPVSRSGLIEHLTPAFAKAAAELIASGAVHWFQIRTVGGAVADIPPAATAYAHRSANFSIVAMGSSERRVDAAFAPLRSHFDGMYLSFETGLDHVADAFPPPTLARLRELKRRYDPAGLFRDNFALGDQS